MSEETRRRIVEAAAAVLARKGYVETTVKDIAGEARVAAGLVHYYFRAKEDLVVAALGHACAQMRAPFEAGDAEAAARAALAAAGSPGERQVAFQRLYVEMLGLSMHNEALRRALVDFVRVDRGHVEAAARAVIAQREEGAPDQAAAIAAAVWGAIFGIQVQRLLEPGFDAGAAVDALSAMALRRPGPAQAPAPLPETALEGKR